MTVADHAKGGWLARLAAGNPVLLAVGAIGFSVSFQTISRLAEVHGLPGWPVLYPVGIDVGILAFTIESRRLLELRRSDLVPRLITWALTGFTIYANIHGSPPHDWVGRALHAVMPCLWVACLELSRRRLIAVVARDRIPLARWVMAPASTFALWRRMVLWDERSYDRALELEQGRRRAIAALRSEHGPAWRSEADSAAVWALRSGIGSAEASAAILAPPERTAEAPAQVTPERPAERSPETGAGPDLSGPPKPAPKAALSGVPDYARKPAPKAARAMPAKDLAPYVRAWLADGGKPTISAVGAAFRVGDPKAREALRLAQQPELHAVSRVREDRGS